MVVVLRNQDYLCVNVVVWFESDEGVDRVSFCDNSGWDLDFDVRVKFSY